MADTVKTSQTNSPWDPQQSHLQNIFGQAQAQNQAIGPFPYPGQQTAGFSPQEQAAQRMTEQFAMTGALDQTRNMQNAQRFALGDVLRPSTNEYLQAHARGAIQPVREELTEKILPQLGSGAVVAGAYGGDRQGIAQGLAVDKSVEDMLNTTSQIYSDNYRAGLDSFNQALRQAPTTLNASTIPAQLLSATGEMDRSLAQALLNEDIARWDFAQQIPGIKTAQYQQAIQGAYGNQSTGTAPSQFQEPSSIDKTLGTLSTGLGVIGMADKISGGAIGDWFSGWFGG